MKLKLTILAFGLLTLNVFGAETSPSPAPLTVAVYDFTGTGDAATYGKKVASLVTANLSGDTNLIIVERTELEKAMGEQSLGNSGMVSSDTAAKIGQITGAKVFVSGQVIKTDNNHLILIANIIGTENGRLFAAKVEGAVENFVDLTTSLSQKITQTIHEQGANFVTVTKSHEEYLERIIKSVTGTNRPSVSVNLHWPKSSFYPSATANTEMGMILQKAGFQVVDGKSETKADVEITGVIDFGSGPRRGGLFSTHAIIDAKVQERRSGKIIAFEHQRSDGIDASKVGADKLAQVNATDDLAAKIVPTLAK